ncbi:MAG: flagellar assembly protein FliW [Acidimicrobiales bacterium]
MSEALTTTQDDEMSVQEELPKVVRIQEIVFSFPAGVPGYPGATSFQLFPLGPEFGPYYGFRCVNDDQPVFIVVQPSAVLSDYIVEVDDLHQDLLGLENAEDALVLLVVTLNGPGRLPTANLAAPLIINLNNNTGFQVLQIESTFEMRHKLGIPFHDPNRSREN